MKKLIRRAMGSKTSKASFTPVSLPEGLDTKEVQDILDWKKQKHPNSQEFSTKTYASLMRRVRLCSFGVLIRSNVLYFFFFIEF